jgi:enoyl-CoA hydratase/carnithine racemase
VRIYNEATDRAFTAIHEFAKPTIAMIRGYCIGGGCALAISCDMRTATEQSRFGIPAAKLGLGYSYGGVKRLADLVGPSFAKEILFTARQFSAEEARIMGLVNRVVPNADLETVVRETADTIAANAPLTIAAVKAIIGESLKDKDERDLARCEAMIEACFASNDYKEGRRAFMEKRKPAFTGT